MITPANNSNLAWRQSLADDGPMSISPEPLLGVPAILLLEVMDKEASLAQSAILYGTLSAAGFLLARKRWWLGLTVLPIVAFFA